MTVVVRRYILRPPTTQILRLLHCCSTTARTSKREISVTKRLCILRLPSMRILITQSMKMRRPCSTGGQISEHEMAMVEHLYIERWHRAPTRPPYCLSLEARTLWLRTTTAGPPLHCCWDKAVTEVLLAYGANIHERDNRGETPLHCAAQGGRPEVVECLVESGAEVDARVSDMFGWTALHMAAADGYRYSAMQSIEWLLMGGANLNTLTRDGQTAYQIANKRGASEEILRLLRG